MRQRYSPKVRHRGGSVDAELVRERLDRFPTLTSGMQVCEVVRVETALSLHVHHRVPVRRGSGEQTFQDLAD
jgi:hypothetical protein